MVSYVPILKSKQAEVWAWNTASPAVLNASRVIFEVFPTNTQTPATANFVSRLSKNYPTGTVVTIDCDLFGQTSTAVTEISQALWQLDIPERPVVHLNDSPGIINQLSQACALHGQGACLRLGSSEDAPNPNLPAQDVLNVVRSIGLSLPEVDLVIDFLEVASMRLVGIYTPLALSMLSWASACGPWRSITLASGAFPRNISDLPTGRSSSLDRFDAILFDSVIQNNPDISPDFGDYGINYPIYGATPPRSPNPNLRYTDGLQWQVERESKVLPGNESFYTVCERTVQAPYWQGLYYSAGDREIERCSRSEGSPGSATMWLRFGASHHFAHVVDRLANLGVP